MKKLILGLMLSLLLQHGFAQKSSVFNIFNLIYKGIISEQISANCEFVPTCSGFSTGVINEFGPVKGLFLTTDRLTRCNGMAVMESEPFLNDPATGKTRDEAGMYRFRHRLPDDIKLPDSSSDRRLQEMICRKNNHVRHSAFKAGLFSALMPGTGKWYLGYPRQAWSSFVPNIFLGASSAELLLKLDNQGWGIAMGGLFTAFYGGNIWGTVSLAKKQELDFYHQLNLDIERFYHKNLHAGTKTLKDSLAQPVQENPVASTPTLTDFLLQYIEYNDFTTCKSELLAHVDSLSALRKTIEDLPVSIKEKSGEKAARLSTWFPGIGQIYAGYPIRGMVSILLTGGFVTLGVFEYINGLYISGTLTGLYPAFRFYEGGRMNAYVLAERKNAKRMERLKEKYRRVIRMM